MARAKREQNLLTSMRNAIRWRSLAPKDVPPEATEQDRLCLEWLGEDVTRFMDRLARLESLALARGKAKPRGKGFGGRGSDPGADKARALIGEFFTKLERDGYERRVKAV